MKYQVRVCFDENNEKTIVKTFVVSRVAANKYEYELKPVFDKCKSFYGKAKVVVNNEKIKLISYSATVAEIDVKNNRPSVESFVLGQWSQTTTRYIIRHMKEFLKQYGFYADNIKQILEDYSLIEAIDEDYSIFEVI